MSGVTPLAHLAVGETSMPFRSTPRLCAHCGQSLTPHQEAVTLEGSRTGEVLVLHRGCFELAYRRTDLKDDRDQRE
jgi:hypothetical protein